MVFCFFITQNKNNCEKYKQNMLQLRGQYRYRRPEKSGTTDVGESKVHGKHSAKCPCCKGCQAEFQSWILGEQPRRLPPAHHKNSFTLRATKFQEEKNNLCTDLATAHFVPILSSLL